MGAICPISQESADIYGDYQVCFGGNGDMICGQDLIHDELFSASQLAPWKKVPSLIPANRFVPPKLVEGSASFRGYDCHFNHVEADSSWSFDHPGYTIQVEEDRKMGVHVGAVILSAFSSSPSFESLEDWSLTTIPTITIISHFHGQCLGIPPLTAQGTSSCDSPYLCGKGTLPFGLEPILTLCCSGWPLIFTLPY